MGRNGDREMNRSSGGYVVVLVGAAAFLVSAFLPFYEFMGPDGPNSVSLVRQIVSGPGNTLSDVGGLLYLLGGVVAIAAIAAVAFVRGPRRWGPPALAGAVVAWATFWIGSLIVQADVFAVDYGYWGTWIGVAIVGIGTVLVLRSARGGT